jgi:hypothetical protein
MAMGKLNDRGGFVLMRNLKDELIKSGHAGLQEEEFVLSMGTS